MLVSVFVEHTEPSFIFALALAAGVGAQVLARHLRVPSIVLLIATGVLLGPDVLGWVVPSELGNGLFQIVRLAVAIILFEGGLNLELKRLRKENKPIRNLVTIGAVVTGVLGAGAARVFMDWDWSLAALFGALVVVTGPTVIKPLLRIVRLKPRVATILEAEGVLIDPVGAILAAVTVEVLVQASMDPLLGGIFLRLGFGTITGLLAGCAIGLLLKFPRVIPEGFANIATLGMVLLLFEACDMWLPESGILAVTVAGVVVGNFPGTRVAKELGEFEEYLTIALIALLFVLLAADIRIATVISLGLSGILTVGALVFVIRPANVLLSTYKSDLTWKEKLFLSWVAPRGVVAAAIASLFAAILDSEGIAGASEFQALVFLTIAVTVILQGGTAPILARVLDLRLPVRDSYVILGAEDLSFSLANCLSQKGQRVIFVDSNPNHCRAAQERGYQVVYGNALAFTTLSRARLERAYAALGITSNDEVNSMFAREASDDFDVRRTFVARSREQSSVRDRLLEKQGSHALFDAPTDVDRWNVRFRHSSASVRRILYMGLKEDIEASTPGSTDGYVMLTVERDDSIEPMFEGFEAREGDRVNVAIHEPEIESVIQHLNQKGWVMDDGDGGSLPENIAEKKASKISS